MRGRVASASGERPLPYATIELIAGERVRRSSTDPQGEYRIAGIPAGSVVLRVRHPGHRAFEAEVQIASGGEVVLDIALAMEPIVLRPIRVRGDAADGGVSLDSVPAGDARLGRIAARTLEATSGVVEIGLGRGSGSAPGQEPADPAGILYVRGAAADLKLVHLDGAPVYAPFPMAGLLEAFAPGVLQGAEIYLGGAPARYDGGLSYIMDLQTRRPGRSDARIGGSIDLLSTHLLAEADQGERLSFLGSFRGINPLVSRALLDASAPYLYREGLTRFDLQPNERTSASLTLFENAEEVRFEAGERRERAIGWGNRAGSLRLRSQLGRTAAELTAALGHYRAELPLTGVQERAAGSSHRSRVSASFVRPFELLTVQYGLSFEQQRYRAATRAGRSEGEVDLRSSGEVLGFHGEAAGAIGPRVHLRAGARLDRFSGGTAEYALAPRLALTWVLSEDAFLRFAAGRFHQFLRPPEEILLGAAEFFGPRQEPTLILGHASHFTVALEQQLGEGTRLGIEGFYKEFGNIPGGFVADANASGVDLWVQHRQGSASGWLGYSLAWAWAGTDPHGNHAFTGRHLLSAGLEQPIGNRTRLGLRFAYGAGLPYAAIPVGELHTSGPQAQPSSFPVLRDAYTGGTDSAPLLPVSQEPYLRLDASLQQLYRPRRGERSLELAPYLRLINDLGRRDALFYLHDPRREEVRRLGTLPIIPVVGIAVR